MIRKEQTSCLSVEGLTKTFNDLKAVDSISFTVNRGEIFGLLGPNGAGKTTVIRMMCGLLRPDAGRIVFGGFNAGGAGGAFRAKIGLCPQDIVIWEMLTCFEQLKFSGITYGQAAGEASKRADELLESLWLSEKRNRLAKTLSGGMQRRLNIALALVHDPDLVILDEPQAGLDPQSRILVRDFIRRLSRKKTVILTTHDMDEADRLSDRVAIIDHGRILSMDSPEALKNKSGFVDILQIRLANPEEQKVRNWIKSLPEAFSEKKYSDGLLLLGGNDLPGLIPQADRMLKNSGLEAVDITVRKCTLEDVFISMTGRGLRE